MQGQRVWYIVLGINAASSSADSVVATETESSPSFYVSSRRIATRFRGEIRDGKTYKGRPLTQEEIDAKQKAVDAYEAGLSTKEVVQSRSDGLSQQIQELRQDIPAMMEAAVSSVLSGASSSSARQDASEGLALTRVQLIHLQEVKRKQAEGEKAQKSAELQAKKDQAAEEKARKEAEREAKRKQAEEEKEAKKKAAAERKREADKKKWIDKRLKEVNHSDWAIREGHLGPLWNTLKAWVTEE